MTRNRWMTAGMTLVAAGALTLAACGDDENGGDTRNCDHRVGPDNDNDQAALRTLLIDVVGENETVCLEEGTYITNSQIDIENQGLTLLGAGQDRTIFDFSGAIESGTASRGIYITPGTNNVTLRHFAVMDTPGDAIEANGVRNIVMRNMTVGWNCLECTENGAYGLYPVQSVGVIIEDSEVYGAADAGVYVGQSRLIRVANNNVYDNVAGIEIENSTDAEVVGNHTYDNTSGILVFNLPSPPIQGGERAKVHDNLVERNNRRNFARIGTIVEQVPPGTGVMVLACSNNEFTNNTIRDNKSHGVLIVNYLQLLGNPSNPDFSRLSMGNYIHGNVFENNGYDPAGLSRAIFNVLSDEFDLDEMPDVIYDGCHDNWLEDEGVDEFVTQCMNNNGDATWAVTPTALLCGPGNEREISLEVPTCTYDELPLQTGIAGDDD